MPGKKMSNVVNPLSEKLSDIPVSEKLSDIPMDAPSPLDTAEPDPDEGEDGDKMIDLD
jgi:hypothetical protein